MAAAAATISSKPLSKKGLKLPAMCSQAHLGRFRPFFLGGLAIFGRFHEIFGLLLPLVVVAAAARAAASASTVGSAAAT
jgi:hypothetical protein